jgi:hypothetical protein
MENLAVFISSRGILKSCHSRNANPVSSSTEIDVELLHNHRAGETIYVCTNALSNFAINFLPQINSPFILVTGDCDVAVTQALLDDPAIASIINSKLLIRWYAQNLAARSPKVFNLPIGMDYHTMFERPGAWGISTISPLSQENLLLNTLASSQELNHRYLAAYCNWRPVAGWGDRLECYETIDKGVCFFETNPIPRNSTWQRQAEFMFVISPEGIGMDCHRTWEALLLGCIPIVKRNAISSLFSELPVLIVDEWTEVNRDRMYAYINSIQTQTFDFSCLFKEFWMNRFNDRNHTILESTSFAEFRKILTRKSG